MLQVSTHKQERTLRHERAVIVVPRPGSRIEEDIAPGSGIVAVMSGDQTVLYFEGNIYSAENLVAAEDRVVCAFGRAAVGYPTIAIRGVLPEEHLDIIPVGTIEWPNLIHWDSPASAQLFLDYAERYQGAPRVTKSGGVARVEVLDMNMTTLLGLYDNPRAFDEWKWIEAHASFEHTSNDVEPGVFEFMVRVLNEQDAEYYETPPPGKVAMVIDLAHKLGASWVLFNQG